MEIIIRLSDIELVDKSYMNKNNRTPTKVWMLWVNIQCRGGENLVRQNALHCQLEKEER